MLPVAILRDARQSALLRMRSVGVVRFPSKAVIARSAGDEAIHSCFAAPWIASRSLSSGAHSRDPLARNDGLASESGASFETREDALLRMRSLGVAAHE